MSYADTATQVAATPGWAFALLLIVLIAVLAVLIYEVFIKPPVFKSRREAMETVALAIEEHEETHPTRPVAFGEFQLGDNDRALLTRHSDAMDEWLKVMQAVEGKTSTPLAPLSTGFEAPPVTSGIMVAVCAACGRKHTEENPIQFDFELMDFLCKEDREDLTAWSSYSPLDSPKEWLAMRQATRDNDITKG